MANAPTAPAFTTEEISMRARDMREIAREVTQRNERDLERDEEALRLSPHVSRWLWVPHAAGTFMAPLTASGKRWAAEVARGCKDQARVPTAYLVTPDRVTAITWDLATAIIEDLPDLPHDPSH